MLFLYKQKPAKATLKVCKVIGTPFGNGIDICEDTAITKDVASSVNIKDQSMLIFLVNFYVSDILIRLLCLII